MDQPPWGPSALCSRSRAWRNSLAVGALGVHLHLGAYADAADECSLSRIYGGIHPPADDIPGRLIGAEDLETIVEAFVAKIRAGRTLDGFIECIEACGELLVEHVPATGPKNELPNHLILL